MTSDEFWARVDRSSECWVWTGVRTDKGYGRLPSHERAHRWAWAEAHGPIPSGFHVCHRCDTPPCVRPDHLFLGTQAENLADMRSKGRGPRLPENRGERNPRARLTWARVREMRREHAAGQSLALLASAYGTTPQNVWYVVTGATWREGNPE